MINVEKQVSFWRESAKSDFEAAELLVQGGKTLQGLFFADLALEKILKGLVCRETQSIPPKTHDLLHLLELSGVKAGLEIQQVLAEAKSFNLEGRYPEFWPSILSKAEAVVILGRFGEVYKWLDSLYQKP